MPIVDTGVTREKLATPLGPVGAEEVDGDVESDPNDARGSSIESAVWRRASTIRSGTSPIAARRRPVSCRSMIAFISARLLSNIFETSCPTSSAPTRAPVDSRYATMSCRISLAVA